jgi:hypothetical protein
MAHATSSNRVAEYPDNARVPDTIRGVATRYQGIGGVNGSLDSTARCESIGIASPARASADAEDATDTGDQVE